MYPFENSTKYKLKIHYRLLLTHLIFTTENHFVTPVNFKWHLLIVKKLSETGYLYLIICEKISKILLEMICSTMITPYCIAAVNNFTRISIRDWKVVKVA